MKANAKTLETALILAVLAFTFVLVYAVHLDYRFPLHVDEWHHIALSTQITDSGRIQSNNPYYSWVTSRGGTKLEAGFHILLCELSLVTGIDLVLHYRLLPALFACISSITLFAFMRRLTKQFWMSLFAMVFFAAIKSSVNILGLWFFTPLTLGIPLVYVFFLTLTAGIETCGRHFLLCSAIVFLSLALIHPVSASFITPIVVLYLAVNYRLAVKNLRNIAYAVPIILVVVLLHSSGFLWKGSVQKTVDFIQDFVTFEYGWGVREVQYNIPDVYGVIPTFLAFIGLLAAYRRRTWLPIIWPIVVLTLIRAYYHLSYAFLAPYQRLLYYLMLGLVPLSALGFSAVLDLTKSLLKARRLVLAASLLLTVLVFALSFRNYYGPPIGGRDLYHAIDENDYAVILFLQEKYGVGNVVLADPWVSLAVYPVGRSHVLSTVRGPLSSGYINEVNLFFMHNCSVKDALMKQYDVDFVLSKEPIECGSLIEEYDKNGTRVYRNALKI